MTLSPADRVMRARIAGLACMAKHGDDIAKPARAGFMAKFEREVDPSNELEPADRMKRADAAMRAHMLTLRLKRSRKEKEGGS